MESTMALALGLGLNGGAGNSAGGHRWQQLVKALPVMPAAAPAP